MIKRKLKDCLNCKKPSAIWAKGKCKACYYLDKNYFIPKVSDKQLNALKEYRQVRDEFMKTNHVCQAKLEGCTKTATDLHHKKGREGKLLTDKKFFMALCRSCHNKIEDGGEWVYEMGFKIRRI